MIKEEIEKAIENGESVWCLYCNEVYEIKIKNHTNRFINTNGNEEMYNYTDENGTDRCFPIKALYKSKAEAEHYLHHANITRTETLPFVTWEEFSEGKEIKFNSKKSEYLMIYLAGNITIYQCYYDDNGLKLELRIFDEEATEANFYKAYDECVRLFRGEE